MSNKQKSSEMDKCTPHARNARGRGNHMTAQARKAVQTLFLEMFRKTGIITDSCQYANIARNTFYGWLEHDETFSLQYHQAEQEASDMLEHLILTRVLNGAKKPVVSMGKIVRDDDGKPLMEIVYSDQLLMFLAKARNPKFREKTHVDVTSNGESLQARHKSIAELLEERLGNTDSNLPDTGASDPRHYCE